MAVAVAVKHLQKAHTDNEKIAALLLVSKVVQAGEVSGEERRQIFNAVGFSFINRLLNTKDDLEGTSDVSAAVSSYQRLAVTLLACFVTDPQLAAHTEVTSKIPLLLEFISIRSSDPETKALHEDCLQVLLSHTCFPRGLHHLVSSGCLQVAARVLVAGGGCRASVKRLLVHVLSQTPVVVRHREEVGEAVSLLATEFRENQGELKFELCSVFYSVLSAVGQRLGLVSCVQQMLVQDQVPWLSDIATGLRDILCSKISSAMRVSALLLSAQLCHMCGVEWTVISGDTKLFRVLANLAAVEVQLCVEGQQLETVTPHSELLCGCCIILETSLAFTATQTQPHSSQRVMTEEEMLQLHSAFSEAFKSIADLLNSLPPPLPPNQPLILAAVRVLGAWLAEESLALTTELYQLLPRLLDMCKAHLQQDCAQGEGGRGGTEDGEHEDSIGIGVGERCLKNPLKFLLPGLSHLMADDTPRSIVKTLLPQLLLEYMTGLYGSGGVLNMSSEAVSSFTLSVEVLLTVCVCEMELRRGEVFTELARLLSRLLVLDALDLRLALQAVLLWLMVAREQGQQCCAVAWIDLWHKIAEILLATLQLCHSIPTPDHTRPLPATTVTTSAETWEPLAELWHLVMREVTAIAASTPDVRQLLLGSESVSQLTASLPGQATHTGGEQEEQMVAIRQLMTVLH